MKIKILAILWCLLNTKILEFNQHQGLDNVLFIIYAVLEYLIEKIRRKNSPENSSTTKVDERIPSSFSISIVSSFKIIENKNDLYRSKDSIKKFCKSLRGHAMEIINFKKKKMKVLRKEQQESYEKAKICHICKEKFKDK